MIRECIKEAIDRHVETGCLCGGFVNAVLENDLKEAFCSADENSTATMRDIVAYLYNNVPSVCWGSKERVDKWRRAGGAVGINKEFEHTK